MRRIFLKATTRQPRNEMIARAERAISDSGGWVLDHHLYSNLAISISFEIAVKNAAELRDRLLSAELGVAPASVAELSSIASATDSAFRPDEPMAGFLHIVFVHDEPDLRREIPAIPG